jgi:hypothetical protein
MWGACPSTFHRPMRGTVVYGLIALVVLSAALFNPPVALAFGGFATGLALSVTVSKATDSGVLGALAMVAWWFACERIADWFPSSAVGRMVRRHEEVWWRAHAVGVCGCWIGTLLISTVDSSFAKALLRNDLAAALSGYAVVFAVTAAVVYASGRRAGHPSAPELSQPSYSTADASGTSAATRPAKPPSNL